MIATMATAVSPPPAWEQAVMFVARACRGIRTGSVRCIAGPRAGRLEIHFAFASTEDRSDFRAAVGGRA